MSIRYVDAARRTGLQTLPCDPDRIARGFRSNERLFILAWSSKFRPVFPGLDVPRAYHYERSKARKETRSQSVHTPSDIINWDKQRGQYDLTRSDSRRGGAVSSSRVSPCL
jgi:hypothetical protein